MNQNQNNSKDRRLHNYDDEYQNKRYEKIYPEEWAKPEYYHGNGPYKYYWIISYNKRQEQCYEDLLNLQW